MGPVPSKVFMNLYVILSHSGDTHYHYLCRTDEEIEAPLPP